MKGILSINTAWLTLPKEYKLPSNLMRIQRQGWKYVPYNFI